MIIRLSVNDNDFSSKLEDYLKSIWIYITETDVLTKENVREMIHTKNKVFEMLNPNSGYELTENDKDFLKNQIRNSFRYWCETRFPSDAEYLSKNLTIEILDVIEDKCENGEACYWLQHSDCVINQ